MTMLPLVAGGGDQPLGTTATAAQRWPMSQRELGRRQLSIAISVDGEEPEGNSDSCTSPSFVPSACPASRPTMINIFKAAETGDTETMARFLSTGGNANKAGKEGYTILHLATMRNQKKMVELLLASGADPDAHDHRELLTPLMWAARLGLVGVAVSLLEGGADSEQEDCMDLTALHWAARMGQDRMTRALLGHQADVEAQDYDGNTSLIWAAKGGHRSCVAVILDYGASTTTPDENGNTALHFACQTGHASVASDLLDRGALPTAQDYWEFTPFHRACSQGHGNVLKELLKTRTFRDNGNGDGEGDGRCSGSMSTDSGGWGASVAGWGYGELSAEPVVAHSLVPADMIDLRNHFQATPLHRAAAKGHAEVISILLRNGADVNARDGFFYTPLHLACINGALACVEVLLENGADPSTKAQGSITPLMAARKPEVRERIKEALSKWDPAKSGVGGPLLARHGSTSDVSDDAGMYVSVDLTLSVDGSSSGDEMETAPQEGGVDHKGRDNGKSRTLGGMGLLSSNTTAVTGSVASFSCSNSFKPPLVSRRLSETINSVIQVDSASAAAPTAAGGPKGGPVTVKNLASGLPRGRSWSSSVCDDSQSFVAGMDIEDPGWNRPIIPDPRVVAAAAGTAAGAGATGTRARNYEPQQEWGRPRRVSTGSVLNKLFSSALSKKHGLATSDGHVSLETGGGSRDAGDGKGSDGDGDPVLAPAKAATAVGGAAAASQSKRQEHTGGEKSTLTKGKGSASIMLGTPSATRNDGDADNTDDFDTWRTSAAAAVVIPPPPPTDLFQPPPESMLHTAPRQKSPSSTLGVILAQPPYSMLPDDAAAADDKSSTTTTTTTASAETPPTAEAPAFTAPASHGVGDGVLSMSQTLQQTAQLTEVVQHKGKGCITPAAVAAAGGARKTTDDCDEGRRMYSGRQAPGKRRAKSLPPFWPDDERRARRRRGGEPRPPRKKIEHRPSMLGPTAVIENLSLDDADVDEGAAGGREGGCGWGPGKWVSASGGGEVGVGGEKDMNSLPPGGAHLRRATTLVG